MTHFWIGLLSILQIYNCNQRLGRDWLVQIVEGKFNKAKTLFEQSYELASKLEQIGRNKETFSDSETFLIFDPKVPSPLLFSRQKFSENQNLSLNNQSKQTMNRVLDNKAVNS